MVRVLVIDFAKVTIITSSFCFAGIIHHRIVLCCLATCCIKATVCSISILTGKKVGLLFHPINWKLMLTCQNFFCKKSIAMFAGEW